ncbi:helicase [Pseudoalteromonas maricaloris]|uniref:DEAD/DEAH box helicase n=1 Tax=Pseudoalteromonas maricaloris TaxID=184924 RepID=UPI0021AD5DBC|nr:DEAD/DEAH box helicase [Pseudoalteromonas flavipulchra]USE70934.1 helicase [Pseudoalteromonas flavipulchra]
MVDFAKLRNKTKKVTPIDPLEIFRRLPKPPGINDLYTSQAEILESWYKRRSDKDVVLKLHTGGGKTLVGLLMAQSSLNETKEPVLYLAPTRQLVNQTIEKAHELGISAVQYERGRPLNEDFLNGKAIMVSTYKALFNGRSKFGIRGSVNHPVSLGAVILDDAHVSFSVLRESFTLEISSKQHTDLYTQISELFRKAFIELNKVGTFDDILEGSGDSIVEVPYWAWQEKIEAVREIIRLNADELGPFVWPLLRDNLHLCHALISRSGITITPVLPLVNSFPSFVESSRRIYMSATIADDSEIVRTFDADPEMVMNALTSRSLAGISERMILIPELMPFDFDVKKASESLLTWTSEQNKLGSIVLVPSDKAAERWEDVATVAEGSEEVQSLVDQLQSRESNGPIVFANRYDGIDLPGDSCRLLVMDGLPSGTSDFELYKASILYGGESIIRMLAQRIEQGIGRGARGAGDHCVVILAGPALASWVAKEANFNMLTNATRAQVEMGSIISQEVSTLDDFAKTIWKSFARDSDWIEYHAETLAENMGEQEAEKLNISIAASERKAFNLWADGNHSKGISKLNRAIDKSLNLDSQTKGWLYQLAAVISNEWGQIERAEDLQKNAFGNNRNLFRPKVLPPYRPITVPTLQAGNIARQLGGYRFRKGLLNKFESAVANLHGKASANKFEQALVELGELIGLSAERRDDNGIGPDVLWVFPNNYALVIEAKSRKKSEGVFTKDNHGQLLVAERWFKDNYPGLEYDLVSVHPTNKCTEMAAATNTFALTFPKLKELIGDARSLLEKISEIQSSDENLIDECGRVINNSNVIANRIVPNYLVKFEVEK